jgi:hypothetical protein
MMVAAAMLFLVFVFMMVLMFVAAVSSLVFVEEVQP